MALEKYEGKWKSAAEILRWMDDRWSKTGFKGSKALGLFLRRYRFEKEEMKYLIEQEKIDQRKAIEGEW